jgi:hypothetical protein
MNGKSIEIDRVLSGEQRGLLFFRHLASATEDAESGDSWRQSEKRILSPDCEAGSEASVHLGGWRERIEEDTVTSWGLLVGPMRSSKIGLQLIINLLNCLFGLFG